jgi:hypothetical protein
MRRWPYCRTRAAAVRESAEKITFPELQATLLRLSLSYERIADSVELCIRRLADNAGNNVSSLLADGGRGSHRSGRLSSSTSGIAPLKKTRRGRRARVERGVKLNRSLVPEVAGQELLALVRPSAEKSRCGRHCSCLLSHRIARRLGLLWCARSCTGILQQISAIASMGTNPGSGQRPDETKFRH